MSMRTVREMEYNRPTERNEGRKGNVDAHGIKVQVAENSREMWWNGLDKDQQPLPVSLAIPTEMVPEVTQAMFDYTNYVNATGKKWFIPTAGKDKDKKVDSILKFYVISREDRGQIEFVLMSVVFTPAAIEAKSHEIENLKSMLAEEFTKWVGTTTSGADFLTKYATVTIPNILAGAWPLPKNVENGLRTKGVSICSIGMQSWQHQPSWALNDDLLTKDDAVALPEGTLGEIESGNVSRIDVDEPVDGTRPDGVAAAEPKVEPEDDFEEPAGEPMPTGAYTPDSQQ